MKANIGKAAAIGIVFFITVTEILGVPFSITVHEISGTVSAYTFPMTDPRLYSTVNIEPPAFSPDIEGADGENYDVFMSNSSGQLDVNGKCVTINGKFKGAGLAGAGIGFNIAQVDLNHLGGLTQYFSTVASYSMGTDGVPGSQLMAVDGNLSTATMFGRAWGNNYMQIVLCNPKNLNSSSTDIVSACCPPLNPDRVAESLRYQGSGGIADRYTLKFTQVQTFNAQMQAYINYLNLIDPSITAIIIAWSLYDQGPPGPPLGNNGTMIETHWTTWTAGGNGSPTVVGWQNFFGDSQGPLTVQYPMKVNNQYMIHTGVFPNQGSFPVECRENDIYVTVSAKKRIDNPELEIRDKRRKVLSRRPIRKE